MAATSEESEGKPLQEKRLLCSKSFDSSTNKEDAFDSRKPSCNEMSKSIVPNENTVDICSLTEEQLHSLLEEATTFNRPKEQDSCILRALRKEIVESDPCGDVNTSDSSSLSVAAASVATVAGHCKRKGGRNVSATSYVVGISSSSSSRGSVGVKSPQQISDDSLTVNHQQTGLQGWTKSEINANSRRRWQNKGTTGREEYYASAAGSGANNSAKKGELQSQSLQDLPSTRFGDPLDSMRAAGIGRGNRRLHNATRANSFTYTGDGAEWLGIPPLQSQVSALDGLRTSGGRNSKSKTKSKTNNNSSGSNSSNSASNNNNNNNINNNPQTVLTIEDETDITRGTLSVSSTESNSKHQTNFPIGPKGWSPVTAPATSSPTRVGTENLKTPLLTFASCDNCDHSEVSLLSCRPLNDETEALENVKSNINGGLGVIDVKSCNETKTGSGVASSSSSPREIEMMELDKGKSQCLDLENRSTFVYNLEGNCRGGMDCRSDVDSQVSFPLKPGRVCSPANKNDIICASVQGQSTHINGILPMTGRSEAVKSIIGNDDSRKGGNNACRASSEFDKLLGKKKFTVQQSWPDDLMFYPNVDFNGNSNTPLMRMPTTFLTQGYSFDAHHNLNKTDLTCSGGGNSSLSSRKAKHSKSKAEKETYKKAEDVAGYCGQLEIDYLVDFINNSGTNEKKKPGGGGTKSGGTISGNVSVINNKNSGSDTGEKKKDRLVSSSSRDATSKGKNGFKRKSRGTGGNISSSGSSEEHNGPEPDRQQHSAESDDGDVTPVRNESPVSDKDDKVELSHHQLHHSVPTTTNSTTISPVTTTTTTTIVSITDQQEEQQPPPPLLPLLQPDIEFVEDFYAIAEIQAPVEESEFRVVVNKQRKKKQQKKSEPFRRYPSNSQNDRSGNNSSTEREFYLHNQQCHSSGMLIYSGLSHRNQRGKPDPSRRKSTSSMPPSEPSSADNSDLDSVHSLPVVGSMPPNTGPHPHTTPSSMSSTPQASYADIARMASAGGGTYSTTVMKKVETSPEIQQATSCIVTEVKDSFPKITETLPATAVPPHPPTTSDSKIAEKPNVVHVSTSPMVSIPTGIAKPKPSPPQQQSSFPHPQTVNPNPGVLVDRDVKSPELVERQDRVESPEVEIQLPEGDANKKRADFSRGSSQETVVATAAVPDSPSQSPRNPQNPTNTPPTTISTSNKSSGHGEILDNANVNPPVISETAEANRVACCVSFGFDEIELMRMSEGCVPVTFEFPVVAGHQPAASAAKDSNTDTTPNSVRPSVKTEVGINEPSPSAGAEGSSRAVDNSAYDASESNRMSSLGENVTVLKGGKRLRFKEKAEDTSSFNQGQIATLLGAAFDNVIQEVQKDDTNKRSGRVCYYNSSQC